MDEYDGQYIQALLKERKLTQQELGDMVGMSASAISKITHNSYPFSKELFQKIARALEVEFKAICRTKGKAHAASNRPLKIGTSLSPFTAPLLYMFFENRAPHLKVCCFNYEGKPFFFSDDSWDNLNENEIRQNRSGDAPVPSMNPLWQILDIDKIEPYSFRDLHHLAWDNNEIDMVCCSKVADLEQRDLVRWGQLSISFSATTKILCYNPKGKPKSGWLEDLLTRSDLASTNNTEFPRPSISIFDSSPANKFFDKYLTSSRFERRTIFASKAGFKKKNRQELLDDLTAEVDMNEDSPTYLILSEPLASWAKARLNDFGPEEKHCAARSISDMLNSKHKEGFRHQYVLLMRKDKIGHWTRSPYFVELIERLTKAWREVRLTNPESLIPLSYLMDTPLEETRNMLNSIEFRLTIDSNFSTQHLFSKIQP